MALLIVFGVVLGMALWARLPETRPVTATETLSPIAAAGRILTHKEFLLAAASSSLIYSALFTWLTTSPFLMIDGLGYSTGARRRCSASPQPDTWPAASARRGCRCATHRRDLF